MTDSLVVPQSALEATQLAFDLNGDSHLDNALGGFFATFAAQNLDFNGVFNAPLQSGRVVMLHTLTARSLAQDSAATWHVYYGKPKLNPLFDGTDHFNIDPAAPTGTDIGPLLNGKFSGRPGSVPFRLRLVPGQPAADLHLVAARISAKCTALDCINGKLGGAIRKGELNSVFLPALAAWSQSQIGPGCTYGDMTACSDTGKAVLQLFDANHDSVITAQEMRTNAFVQALLSPDLDLFGADGKRGHDGVEDSISFGVGFTAVKAIFPLP